MIFPPVPVFGTALTRKNVLSGSLMRPLVTLRLLLLEGRKALGTANYKETTSRVPANTIPEATSATVV